MRERSRDTNQTFNMWTLGKYGGLCQTIISNAFSYSCFGSNFTNFVHWYSFDIIRHWLRQWPVTCKATSHCLIKSWRNSPTHKCVSWGNELISKHIFIAVFAILMAGGWNFCSWSLVCVHRGHVTGLRPTSERRLYKVALSLIGWTQTQNQPSMK